MNEATPSISNITHEVMKPVLAPEFAHKFSHLMPKINNERFSFMISGVSVTMANALRRVMACEVPVRRLRCEVEDIVTNDVFIIPENIITRIESIPIMQIVKVGAKFTLEASNPTETVRKVYTAAIKDTQSLLNDNMVLFDLQPGTNVKISLVVVEGRAYRSKEGMAAVGLLASSVPLDVEPFLGFALEDGKVVAGSRGVSSLMADPRSHKISFMTNGTITPQALIKMACQQLAIRCQQIIDAKNDFVLSAGVEPEYSLELNSENSTIGEVFMRSVLDIVPDVPSVSYKEDTIGSRIILHCQTDDIAHVVTTSMKHAKAQFIAISASF